jgi:hypothetical protein
LFSIAEIAATRSIVNNLSQFSQELESLHEEDKIEKFLNKLQDKGKCKELQVKNRLCSSLKTQEIVNHSVELVYYCVAVDIQTEVLVIQTGSITPILPENLDSPICFIPSTTSVDQTLECTCTSFKSLFFEFSSLVEYL